MATATRRRLRPGGGPAPSAGQQPTPRPARAAPKPTHSEWRHGPVAAAVNSSIWIMVFAFGGRLASAYTQPVWVLVAGLALSGSLLVAGRWRTVRVGNEQVRRPLSARSVMYRFTAMLTAAVWLWVQLADFSRVNRDALGPALVAAAVAGGLLLTVLILFRAGQARLALIVMLPTGAVVLLAGWLLLRATGTGIFLDTRPIRLGDAGALFAWMWPALLSLVIFAAVFAIIGAACANHELDQDAEKMRWIMNRSSTAARAHMQVLLRELSHNPNLQVTDGPLKWPNGAGEEYRVDGSIDGVGAAELGSGALKSAAAARLRLKTGCGVEVVPGEHRGESIVKISLVNKIKDEVPYPMDQVQQRSIYNPLPVGILRDGTVTGPILREYSAFLWGQKRSGKTTTLTDLMAGLAQCTDVLLWVIDLGGGGAAAEFIYPAAMGHCRLPGVDWVATTREEAKLMVDCAHAIAITRKKVYQWRKRHTDETLLPLDQHLPWIGIVIDEGAEVTGDAVTRQEDGFLAGEIRDKLAEINRIAGDGGVAVVMTGLRAVSDVIDPGMLAQLAVRIGMRVSDDRELAYGFGQDYSLDRTEIPYQGSGFISNGPDTGGPRVFKAFNIRPSGVHRIVVQTAEWRPVLDHHSRMAAGPAYATRWNRTWHLIRNEQGEPVMSGPPAGWDIAPAGPLTSAGIVTSAPAPASAATAVAVLDPPAGDPPPPVGPGGGDDTPATGDGGDPAPTPRPPTDHRSPAQAMRDADEVLRKMGIEPTGDSEFDAVISGAWSAPPPRRGGFGRPVEPPQMPVHLADEKFPDGRQVLEALLLAAGPQGLSMKEICVRLTTGGTWGPPVEVSRQTVDTWLKDGGYLADRKARQNYVHRDCVGGGT